MIYIRREMMIDNSDLLFNKYRIVETIGKGGMAEVLLAKDVATDELFAIKRQGIIKGNYELVENELLIQKSLNHPAIPKVYDSFIENDFYYIVMEYVRGISMEEVFKDNASFSEGVVLEWYRQLCDVLIYLHSRTTPIVYRDLKPSNIIIQSNGTLKLIDFGIAETYAGNTGKKRIIGLTKGYAAPEQYSSRFIADVRTDIYSLAVTMHYALTGKNPQIPPYVFKPVRKYNSDYSRAIGYIVHKSLQLNPEKRYRNAEELRDDLNGIEILNKRLEKKALINRLLWGGGALGVLIVLFLVFIEVVYVRNNHIHKYDELIRSADVNSNYNESEMLLDEAIEYEPNEPLAYIKKAELYLKNGETEKALDFVKNEILPCFGDIYDNVDFLLLMGDIYREKGEYENALFYYEKLYKICPEDESISMYYKECIERINLED